MELSLIKLLFYSLIGVAGVLFIYITSLGLFLHNDIQKIKAANEEIKQSSEWK